MSLAAVMIQSQTVSCRTAAGASVLVHTSRAVLHRVQQQQQQQQQQQCSRLKSAEVRSVFVLRSTLRLSDPTRQEGLSFNVFPTDLPPVQPSAAAACASGSRESGGACSRETSPSRLPPRLEGMASRA